jgi:hypothetical protein
MRPNPANDQVQIIVSDELIGAELKVLDLQGRIISQQSISALNFELRTSSLSQGIYFVQASRIANPNTLRQHVDRIAFTSPEQI